MKAVDDYNKPRTPVAEMNRKDFISELATFVKLKRQEKIDGRRNSSNLSGGGRAVPKKR